MRFPMKCCINDVNFIGLLLLSTELFKFEIQKYGQILCVHKPYFLMPGHIFEDDECICLRLTNLIEPCSGSVILGNDTQVVIAKDESKFGFCVRSIRVFTIFVGSPLPWFMIIFAYCIICA